ncbi:hypothetical protein [Halobiforma nitratireducens]|nr:hypothetical protein [Halobiforma nitratireducens]
MSSVENLSQQFIESDGLWAIERLRAFDVAFHSFGSVETLAT